MKKNYNKNGKSEISSIKIEDPLDFLTAKEKAEYLSAKKKNRSENRSYKKDYFDDEYEEDELDDEYEDDEDDVYEDDDEDDIYDDELEDIDEDEEDEEDEDDEEDDEDDEDDDEEFEERYLKSNKRRPEIREKGKKRAVQKPKSKAKDSKKNRFEEDSEGDTDMLDKFLSAAVKICAVIIALLVFAVVWGIFLLPMIKSGLGLNKWTGSSKAGTQTSVTEAEKGASVNGNDAGNTAQEDGGWDDNEQYPDEDIDDDETTVVVIGDSLNLRTGPSTDAEIVVRVNSGTRLIKIAEEGGWTLVEYEGQQLYGSSQYLREE